MKQKKIIIYTSYEDWIYDVIFEYTYLSRVCVHVEKQKRIQLFLIWNKKQ